jgi:GH15 family glucan-1,4-alpha-glucosidase
MLVTAAAIFGSLEALHPGAQGACAKNGGLTEVGWERDASANMEQANQATDPGPPTSVSPSSGPLALEDYGIIGDCSTCAVVGRNGSIDWLCWPRFDSPACFAALLGDARNGRWLIAPADSQIHAKRYYRGESLILETLFETPDGSFAVIDFMPPFSAAAGATGNSSIVRIVEGRTGRVAAQMHLVLRFDYGASTPWVVRLDEWLNGIVAVAGPNLAVLRTSIEIEGRDMETVGSFVVEAGQSIPFVLTFGPSHIKTPAPIDAVAALRETEAFWADWASRCTYRGEWRDAVMRSLITLKALTFGPTGGIVAAATTSLPEQLGGERNWDYRICWLRDATLTLLAMMEAGYYEEAASWRDWLHRAVAGSPNQIQIMYGLAGERRLDEMVIPWLRGYQGAAPVRVGNAAADQLQLDVYGEVMDALHQAREGGLSAPPASWTLQVNLVEHLAQIWNEPDEGIWEVRGGRRQFTFSKVMAWVALDRSIRDAETFELSGPVDHWRQVRDEIHATVCERGYSQNKHAFVQVFGSEDLDASLLLIPLVGFLPHDDPRVRGTVQAIQNELMVEGFVLRYRTETGADGLPPGEGAFLACSFWLADCLQMQGRVTEARALFERLLSLRNDLGLLSEEYDARAERLVGNFPQAFSHIALISTAMNLTAAHTGPAEKRQEGD